jgi:acetyl esterase/lipase
MLTRAVLTLVVTLALSVSAVSQQPTAQATLDVNAALALSQQVRTAANLVYLRANGWEGRLDVYAQRGDTPTPTVLFFHGGGWTQGSKEASATSLLPWLTMGYSVVNVEYRLASVSPAPAAIEDSRCALRWVHANAKEYGFDTARLVTTGQSAGAHLALMTGMAPVSAGFDRICLTAAEPKVGAIVNFYGITDVGDLLDGPNKTPFPWPGNRPYAVQWLGNPPNRAEIAQAASPLTYVRPGAPPVISIQGDADPTVPYSHSVRLHEALQKAGVVTEHVPIPKGLHGNFTLEEWQRAFARIQAFLHANGMGTTPGGPAPRGSR